MIQVWYILSHIEGEPQIYVVVVIWANVCKLIFASLYYMLLYFQSTVFLIFSLYSIPSLYSMSIVEHKIYTILEKQLAYKQRRDIILTTNQLLNIKTDRTTITQSSCQYQKEGIENQKVESSPSNYQIFQVWQRKCSISIMSFKNLGWYYSIPLRRLYFIWV